MTKFADVRGCLAEPIRCGSLLLFKQGNLCSSSHYSSRTKKTYTLRVILLRGGIIPLNDSLLFEEGEYVHSASHYYSRRKNISTLRVTIQQAIILIHHESLLSRKGKYLHSTSHSSRMKKNPTRGFIALRALPSDKSAQFQNSKVNGPEVFPVVLLFINLPTFAFRPSQFTRATNL